jgi:methyl-accepting chemotaxis protein
MNNLKVSTRLAITTGLLALLLAVVGGIGLHGMKGSNDGLHTVYDDRVVPLGQLAQIQRLMSVNELAVQAALLGHMEADKAAALMQGNRSTIDATWAAYMATKLTEEEARLAKQFAAERATFVQQGLEPAMQALRRNETERAQRLSREAMAPAAERTRATLDKLMGLQVAVAKVEFDTAVARYDVVRLLTLGSVGTGLLVALVLGVQLTRSLTRQLGAEPGEAAAVAQAVARGDLAMPIALRQGDDNSLMASLSRMQASLREAVSAVRRDADSVATASSEIAQGTLDLSQRTEQQASALQQTAASMEELTSTVRQNADNAQMARQLADGAATVAHRGGRVVGDVVETMKGIEGSSRRIADIIGVIDGIAFQTNILALNAAVEAARAGEQGRGFAVVASEVRNLAQRSAEAAKEVKVLINDSVQRVDAGAALAAQAGGTMQEIVSSIERVKDIVGEISAACVEQSTGVAQVGEAVTQMDQVTQQNAALVEESSAAAESLKTQARNLQEAVAVFQVGEDVVAAPTAKPATAAHKTPAHHPAKVTARPRGLASAPAPAGAAGEWATF